MEKPHDKYFYLFRGTWFQRLDDVVKVVSPDQSFEIWEHIDKTRESHLLIVYDKPLPSTYCLYKNFWKTTEEIARLFYYEKEEEFSIHKYADPASAVLMKTG